MQNLQMKMLKPPTGIFFFSIGLTAGAALHWLSMRTTSSSGVSLSLFPGGVKAFDTAPLLDACGENLQNKKPCNSHTQHYCVFGTFAFCTVLLTEASWKSKNGRNKTQKHSCKMCPAHVERPTIMLWKWASTMSWNHRLQSQVCMHVFEPGTCQPENKAQHARVTCQTLQRKFSSFPSSLLLSLSIWPQKSMEHLAPKRNGRESSVQGVWALLSSHRSQSGDSTWPCMKQHKKICFFHDWSCPW